ncbi:MAG: ring-hydroxylating dioxygenase subunit beta [Hydrogenophaga sp.]|uniref:aromatic-ring-hydroxylating dioxygenase subunit beta n=1 Tax=Hydrogenophaga sp. TaxID=1904254 RepID=UPI0016B9690C|nr:aromatic-ring-hydroxylating dioxygenase subunit beta [Hydrogenophaga sp.]NIM43860.1 ring-hydroxylating dioxygenase subunit beta [Hydrogenophaga sp.]NIN28926.1 ring-hydroxylating dioxygenase subunit beta [Hydrogenophaga sp.]NIN33385.1 ring-hydroxylating dioxygenase subunit beta [Hydrogenophaga sp.]NIN58060.1 ring-hydroxylating dioxygenase subunit beta [Hydrogenophaga sp.]NIO54358.1 ring-hydroxylating dioxygenase subunit beta [Hydrogenophaga sp.]
MPMTTEQRATLEDVTQFIYREARLQDEHRYDEWESLWTEDGVYWVPANGDGGDPEQVMSIIYDNRSRIALRIRQYHTGKRFSQTPQSRLRRLISNIEVMEDDGSELSVGSNVLIFENQTRGDVLWAARTEYRLRRVDGALRMARKKVNLVNNQDALYSMAFLV